MNRLKNGLLCVVICLGLSACGGSGGGSNPGDVVKRYGQALAAGDIKAAVACIAPADRQQGEEIVKFASGLVSAFVKAEGGLDSVTILKETVEGDRAMVSYQTRTKKGVERQDNTRVRKIDGAWYIAR